MSSQFRKDYKEKLRTAEEAVKIVKSGDWIDYGHFNGKPVSCDRALAARKDELKDIVVISAVTLLPVPEVVMKDPAGEVFTYLDLHFSPVSRIMQEKRDNIFYHPILYNESEFYYECFDDSGPRSDKTKIGGPKRNVFIIRTAPMDEYGFFNWGIHNSISSVQAEYADTVIVEVNEKIPRALGGAREQIHISDVTFIVESENDDLMELQSEETTDVDKKIAANVVEHLFNGCCIQLGIGGMPNALGRMICETDLKDLGGQTEMLVDSYMHMWEAGRMNGKKKANDRNKICYTFALGSKELYSWANNNPALASYNVEYANHPKILGEIDNLISVNQALEVDLYAQVNAESAGFKQVSGVGGMWDYVTGSYWSKGGKSFICIPSTHKDKEGNLVSNIVPFMQPGSIITISRPMVNHIVTEYGSVNLKAECTWRKTEKLISIAHPDFRDDLIKAAEQQKLWRKTNKIL